MILISDHPPLEGGSKDVSLSGRGCALPLRMGSGAASPRSLRCRSRGAGLLAQGGEGCGRLALMSRAVSESSQRRPLQCRETMADVSCERRGVSHECRTAGGPVLVQHAASPLIRLMFSAKHTRCHSPRTFSTPRRLNRLNPSTSLIQPFGASEIHLRLAY